MAIISVVYAVQGYVTFQVNSQQLVESVALKNQVTANNLIQNLDLFVDRRISDFESLEKAKEIREILESSNSEFSQIKDIDVYMDEKTFSYENFDRYLPFITQAVERKHQQELTSIIQNYDQTYGFDFAEEFFVTNAYGANIVLILGVSDYVQYDKEWWQETKANGIYVGDLNYYSKYGTFAVPIGIAITNDQGNFLGAVKVLIGLEHLLSDFTNNISLLEEQNKQVMLLNNDGQVIYSNGIQYDQNIVAPFASQLDSSEGNFEFTDNDSAQVISYAKSKGIGSSGLGWTVIVKQSESDIISSLEDVRNSLLLPSIVGVAVTVVIGIIITLFVSRPLEKLTKTYRQLSSGNFDVRAEPSSVHEINILSKAYNELASSLKKLIQTEKELAEARVKVKNERLTAIGELSASMAHDMKNPLAVLKTATDVLKRKFKGKDEKIDKLFYNMDDGINRLSHQIKDVLEYVRITPVNLAKTSLIQMIDTAVSSIKIPPNVTIKFPTSDIAIECDKQKMEIVFINLILNAIQAIGEKQGEVEFVTSEDQDYYTIEIKDTGEPIPEDVINKIFEPLYTTKHQGTGLGLATCKNVIEQHGGTITAKNNPTTFTIKFPKKVTVNSTEKDKYSKD